MAGVVAETIPKAVRMQMLFERMRAHPAAGSHDEARRMVEEVLNAVEDEYSGVPFDPEKWRTEVSLA
jgi:hypothetical protein